MNNELGRLPPPFNRLMRGYAFDPEAGLSGFTARAYGPETPCPHPFNAEQVQRCQCRTAGWQFSCQIFDDAGGDSGFYESTFTDQDPGELYPTIASRRQVGYGVSLTKDIEINTSGGEEGPQLMQVQASFGLAYSYGSALLSDGGIPEKFWPTISFSGNTRIFYYESTSPNTGPHSKWLAWGSVRTDSSWIEWGTAIFSDGKNSWTVQLYREPDIWEGSGWTKVNDYIISELIFRPSYYLTS